MIQATLDLGAPPAKLRMPHEPIIRDAEIEDNYRWTMKRAWGAGPCISWTLLNPSNADGTRDDPTTKRMIGFSYRWGFGSMIVTNLYPFISASQEALRNWRKHFKTDAADCIVWPFDQTARSAWLHNMDVVRGVLRSTETHVAAWGNGADDDELIEFLDEVSFDYDASKPLQVDAPILDFDWKCLGDTASGAPVHPLARGAHRIPDDAELVPWPAR